MVGTVAEKSNLVVSNPASALRSVNEVKSSFLGGQYQPICQNKDPETEIYLDIVNLGREDARSPI